MRIVVKDKIKTISGGRPPELSASYDKSNGKDGFRSGPRSSFFLMSGFYGWGCEDGDGWKDGNGGEDGDGCNSY